MRNNGDTIMTGPLFRPETVIDLSTTLNDTRKSTLRGINASLCRQRNIQKPPFCQEPSIQTEKPEKLLDATAVGITSRGELHGDTDRSAQRPVHDNIKMRMDNRNFQRISANAPMI